MATAKSRSLSPILHPGRLTLKEQVRQLWSSIVAVFIMEEPDEFAFHPDLEKFLQYKHK